MLTLPNTSLIEEASDFIKQFYQETDRSGREERWQEILTEIEETGTYEHTYDELNYGAKLAWRNSNRCIGRLFWKTLKVVDCRLVSEAADFEKALRRHLRMADNDHKIRSVISIFPPLGPSDSLATSCLAVRQNRQALVKNYTLLLYAGYETEDGIVGDPANVDFTKHCQSLGWRGEGTAFDLLPVVYSPNGSPDRYYEIPRDLVTEIEISHPEYAWFADFGLKWYKLPVISSMQLSVGGIIYPCCPFNGWYMLDEVATRNFGDKGRYNMLPKIAEKMGLETSSPFWREKALLALNEAVYHSYQQAGARIVDHHTAVEQFMTFVAQEEDQGRVVTGDWSWLVPPHAGSTTEVFHRNFKDEVKLPNYLPSKS